MPETFSTIKAALAIAAVSAVLAVVPASDARSDEPEVHLLFVQGAKSMQADTGTLRLVGVADQTIYFSDRPVRIAGHADTGTFVAHWAKGDDSFATNPPNATLSVYNDGLERNSAAVLVLSDPVLYGGDLVYGYELLGGTVPETGGAVALFIDTFGPGRGVGAGFHGVGVGARGPGVTGWRGVAAINECEATNSC